MSFLRRVPLSVFVIGGVVLLGGCIGAWRLADPPSHAWHIHPGRGPRLTVNANGRCPDPLPKYTTVANRGGGLPSLFVPRHPIGGLICRYGPEQSPADVLYRQTRLGASAASAIASAVDAIQSAPPPNAPISCPSDSGSVTFIAFAYANGAQAEIEWDDSGCQQIANGNRAAFEDNSGFQAFRSILDAVAPPGIHEG